MNDLTFNILKIVISVAIALITTYLVPFLKNKIAQEKYNDLLQMVNVAVLAAEQTIGSGMGSLKKEEVVKFVSSYMNERGIKITKEQLSNLIEAAVFAMNKELK